MVRDARRLSLATWTRPAAVQLLVLTSSVCVGVGWFIVPIFGELSPVSGGGDFNNHVALVAAARETFRETGALPLSSDAIYPGVEYPYFLFGNQAFWIVSALVSLVLQAPAYIGAGVVLGLAFAAGTVGMYALARQAGLGPYLALALGFLYASGPYLSVNLFLRFAFPEYVTWQAVPVLLLSVQRGLRLDAGSLSLLGGALALAAPFYLHKLLAPYLVVTLAALALNCAPPSARTIIRLGLIGVLALFLSVPAWLPWLRAFDRDVLTASYARDALRIYSPSLLNLFWPYAQNSLTDVPAYEVYQQRFALQVGLVPSAGFLVGLWLLATRPTVALRRRLITPLALFSLFTCLTMGLFGIWSVTPSVFQYIQFTYRLIGVMHFVGFILLVQSLGGTSPRHVLRIPRRLTRPLGATFVVVAIISAMTYWHRPALTPRLSADIRPNDLGDFSRFFKHSVRGNLVTDRAVGSDGWLAVPPAPIFVAGTDTWSLILSGTTPSALFEDVADPLRIRIFGFGKERVDADAGQLTRLYLARRRTSSSPTSLSALFGDADRPTLAGGARAEMPAPIRLPNTDWSATLLAEVELAGSGPFELRVPLASATVAVAVECGRAVAGSAADPPTSEAGTRCVRVEVLATPNDGDAFVAPTPIPIERRTRFAYGRLRIDAGSLPAGHYLLPTFDYNFVSVRRPDGTAVSTYQYEGRTAIRHDGLTDAYAVGYDLVPELLAPAVALVVLVLYAAGQRLRIRVPAPSLGRWRTRRGESRGTA